jgi:transcriptional regulator with XRE-family HTH domain
MNGATLKTLREALGLNVAWLASAYGVQERSVRYWESGKAPVPDDVAQSIEQLEMLAATMVSNAASLVRAHIAEHGAVDGAVRLVRYETPDDLAKYQPDMKGLPVSFHAAALARTRWALEPDGVAVDVHMLDAAAYEAWRRSTRQPDSPALRSTFVVLE